MGANLKEVRGRITSVKSTQQITKAMKLVAASKLRKAQEAITQMRPYADKLNSMLMNILSNLDTSDLGLSYGVERPVQNALLVVVTSNRGLAGAFNTNVLKEAVSTINGKYKEVYEAGGLTIMCIGKKGADFFRRRYTKATKVEDHMLLFNDLTFDNVSPVSSEFMQAFLDGSYDSVSVVYSRFRNAAMQIPECYTLLPVPKQEAPADGKGKQFVADYIFEPSKKELLEQLIPSILQTTFYKFLLDTHASEHGARMTAMDKATENAEDLLKDLKITYNKARQEAITKELSEIVGGAAALEGA